MAWAQVTGQFFNGSTEVGSTTTGAFTNATTTGNTVVVWCFPNQATKTVSSIAISPGSGTFAKITGASVVNAADSLEIWAAANITGGAAPTVTVTWSASGSSPEFVAGEFSGGLSSITTDVTTATSTGTNTALSVGSITTATDGDLVIKSFGCGGTGNGTVESGWTEKNPTTQGHIAGYIVQGTHGSITGTDTQSPSSSFAGIICALKAASGGGTTWNATATIASLARIPTETATAARGAVTTVITSSSLSVAIPSAIWSPAATLASTVKIVGTGQGGGMWNSINDADVWDGALTVWDAPDYLGVGDVWNSSGSSWDSGISFWDSAGMPVAQAVLGPTALIGSKLLLASPVNTWDSSGIFWSDPNSVWDAYAETAQIIAQGTDTIALHATISTEVAQAVHQATDAIATRVLLSTEVAQAVHQAVITLAPHLTLTEVAQAIHQATDTILVHASLTEVAQAVHQATDTIAAKVTLTGTSTKAAGAILTIASHLTLTEVAQLLAQGTAVIATHAAASTEVGQAIHQATDTLHPFITLFATANVPTQGGTTWNVTAVITLKILLSETAQAVMQPSSAIASRAALIGPGIGGDLWNGLTTTWNSAGAVWDSWLGTADLWDSSTVPWNSALNLWDSVGQPLAQVVAEPTTTIAMAGMLASPVNTWDSGKVFWSDPNTVWDAYLPTAQAVHQATDALALKATLSEVAQAILQPTSTISAKVALTELATKLLSAISAIQSKVTLTAIGLRAAAATAQISSHATITPVAQALHQALLSIVSRTGISASAAAIFRPSVLIGAHFLLVPNASGTAIPIFIRWDDADPMSIAATAAGAPVWDDAGARFVSVLAPILSVWGDKSTFWSDPAGVWDSARRRD